MHISDKVTPLADSFLELTSSLKPGINVVDTMDQLVVACIRGTDAVAADVLFSDFTGKLHVVASSDRRAADMENAQFQDRDGPSSRAIHSGKPLEVAEIALTRRAWPAFAEKANAYNIHASQAVPLRFRTHSLGGLNLFFDRRGGTNSHDLAFAQAVAQVAVLAIVQNEDVIRRGVYASQLHTALDDRRVIDEATQMLALQREIDTDGALDMLRALARNNHTGLSSVARQLAPSEHPPI
jgi:hypothetical protein